MMLKESRPPICHTRRAAQLNFPCLTSHALEEYMLAIMPIIAIMANFRTADPISIEMPFDCC